MKIKTERLIKTKRGRNPRNAMIGKYEVVISGISPDIDEILQAIFGSFYIRNGEATYTATICTDENGKIFHNYESEFEDDYDYIFGN